MSNLSYRIFPNKVELFKFFGQYTSELNLATSARMPFNCFAVGTEARYHRSFPEFIKALADLAGLNINVQASAYRVGSYIIFFNGDLPSPHRRGATVVATPEVVNVVVEEKSAFDVESAPASAAPAVNVAELLEKASALNDEADKKGSKDKLAEFADGLGITLAKNKTFENMLADFKTAVEAK